MARRTYAELEGGDDDEQLPLLPVKVLEKQLKKLKKRLRREEKEKRLRALARKVVQEELFDHATPAVTRKKADRTDKPAAPRDHKATYTAAEFEPKLRETIKQLCDPTQLDKLVIRRVLDCMHITQNTLWDELKDYGYAHEGETCSKCLNRLADEWHPQWRGANRQRF